MTKKKCVVTEEVSPALITVGDEDKPGTEDLRACLEEISTYEGVRGYILRNSAAAVINFEAKTKTTEYALLSSQAFETCDKLGEIFSLGGTIKLLVECVDVDMHCMVVGDAMVSLFLAKDVDLAEVLAKLVS